MLGEPWQAPYTCAKPSSCCNVSNNMRDCATHAAPWVLMTFALALMSCALFWMA
jgi:hypothetical protein